MNLPETPVLTAPPLARTVDEVARVFLGDRSIVECALAGLLAGGHLLLEDVPGVGKTTLSRSLAAALGLSFRRIQFTSDLLPSDLLGGAVYSPTSGEFRIRKGPVFSQMILADEINRAPPRTQGGLLEAMQEGRVTLDDQTFELPRPFHVIATQNPTDHLGTYPLPESQLDRFAMVLRPGYPSEEAERRILTGSRGRDAGEVGGVLDPERLLELQAAARQIHVSPELLDYILRFVRRTREHPGVACGVSPRGAGALLDCSRALALVRGRDFVSPDEVEELIVPCLMHRIVPAGAGAAGNTRSGALLLREISEILPLPR